ncbi:hypothetical protein SAMN04488515_1737 [Cognatiyoonia koreensis]|uniref:Uncharacterized protein n=1 Tax=Cognatiyoonia koreensis TaxID=364200 RepID=A0A1I0Q8C0_9RHOB|nr:hypothetical protein SAMN04488515_1737 [Cognatiyoonia koreensis]
MQNEATGKSRNTFPTIESDMVNRLVKEAEERTMQPQQVDWKEVHQQASLVRDRS